MQIADSRGPVVRRALGPALRAASKRNSSPSRRGFRIDCIQLAARVVSSDGKAHGRGKQRGRRYREACLALSG